MCRKSVKQIVSAHFQLSAYTLTVGSAGRDLLRLMFAAFPTHLALDEIQLLD